MGQPFGAWLKKRRRELGLTQDALAEQAGCSAEMVRKIEAGSARPSRQMAELIVANVGVPSTERSVFTQWARGGLTATQAGPVIESDARGKASGQDANRADIDVGSGQQIKAPTRPAAFRRDRGRRLLRARASYGPTYFQTR
jgi:transcriptional regulator with XRE-family HTH domain